MDNQAEIDELKEPWKRPVEIKRDLFIYSRRGAENAERFTGICRSGINREIQPMFAAKVAPSDYDQFNNARFNLCVLSVSARKQHVNIKHQPACRAGYAPMCGLTGRYFKVEEMKHIHSYYSPNDLYNKIIQGLNDAGKDLANVTLDDLQPVDEFHIRGDTATKELIKLSSFTPEMHILDVGCGVGGSARRLSHQTGCCVTGIDLSDEYIDAAIRLTQLLNMQERVKFHAASALALPFDDHTFDGVWSIQMNMNIDDKLGWLKEVYRVLRHGGRAVLYEVCGSKNTPVYFPVPWAQDSSMSFLIPPESFRDVITSAGFDIDVWNDKTDLAQNAFAHMTEPVGEPDLPELGVHLLVGNDILTKAYNLHRNLDDQRVSLIETVVVKP